MTCLITKRICATTLLSICIAGTRANALTPAVTPARARATIRANDNVESAGRLRNGTLEVSLIAARGTWYPEGVGGTAIRIAAWGEPNRPLQDPGPVVRLTLGQTVRATLANSLDRPLTVFGFGEKRGLRDSVVIAPGRSTVVSFKPDSAGTFYYVGTVAHSPPTGRDGSDSQLNGAIVVVQGDIMRSKANVYGNKPGYSFVLGGTPAEADLSAMPVPGPTLMLGKDAPVAVTIVNRKTDRASVHWHGVELDSYPDGVPGVSGTDTHLLPSIGPNDSLTIHFTPQRAGTFMYHSHFNEFQQISSGAFGPIIVLEKGKTYDSDIDRLLFDQATSRPAQLTFGSGEIYDFEFTPAHAGNYSLVFSQHDNPTTAVIRVR